MITLSGAEEEGRWITVHAIIRTILQHVKIWSWKQYTEIRYKLLTDEDCFLSDEGCLLRDDNRLLRDDESLVERWIAC